MILRPFTNITPKLLLQISFWFEMIFQSVKVAYKYNYNLFTNNNKKDKFYIKCLLTFKLFKKNNFLYAL